MKPKGSAAIVSPLSDILTSGENQVVEFNEMSGGVNPKALAHTMVAFANADGGDIYIGVADDGTPIGVRSDTANMDHILNSAREICRPPLEIQIRTFPAPRGSIIQLHVDRSLALHSLSNGMVLIRVGSQDKRIAGEDIARLATAKSLVSFEDQPMAGAAISDLDETLIEELRSSPANSHRMTRFSKEDVLKAYQMIDREGNLSAAATLLFAKEPSRWFFNAGAIFVKFSGTSGEGSDEGAGMAYLDREEISLPISRSIDRLIEKITASIERGGRVAGAKRTEEWEYPPSVYRECVVNALAHRDYRIHCAKTEVRLYADGMEIRSPGSLPGFMTIETLGTRHYPRNPKIMRCLLDWGYVESLGLGIANMKRTLSALGFPPPAWENHPDEFRVSISKRPFAGRTLGRAGELSGEEQKTLRFIYEHSSIDRKTYIALHEVSESKAKQAIRRLVDKGLVELEGKGPSSRYVIRRSRARG